jgi:hypothetical protein
MVLVILFLHDVHASFSAILIFGIRIWFKKVCFILDLLCKIIRSLRNKNFKREKNGL